MRTKAKTIFYFFSCAVILSAWSGGVQAGPAEEGMALMKGSDCFTCHRVAQKLIGPAYKDVAAKYAGADDAKITELANKIINGGAGNWGTVPMRAHPDITFENAKKMVMWVLTQSAADGATTPATTTPSATTPGPSSALPADNSNVATSDPTVPEGTTTTVTTSVTTSPSASKDPSIPDRPMTASAIATETHDLHTGQVAAWSDVRWFEWSAYSPLRQPANQMNSNPVPAEAVAGEPKDMEPEAQKP